ncbi:hypothetical protein [Bradyrhizobium japonicum]|uniref:hypothetical protein n=1 Tax=Bradyrhizobium japonicum TaxID=375 RepID=UPI001FDA3B28|nr:hypothetical protein [Bradyrhizobium japonicum]
MRPLHAAVTKQEQVRMFGGDVEREIERLRRGDRALLSATEVGHMALRRRSRYLRESFVRGRNAQPRAFVDFALFRGRNVLDDAPVSRMDVERGAGSNVHSESP